MTFVIVVNIIGVILVLFFIYICIDEMFIKGKRQSDPHNENYYYIGEGKNRSSNEINHSTEDFD
jgi:hypothetical protein